MRKRRKFEESSSTEILLLRERLGIRRYRKSIPRNEEERKILLDLALKKIEEREKDDFILIGHRKRRMILI